MLWIAHEFADLTVWAFRAMAAPVLLLLVTITWWTGRAVGPVALLSRAFWPGAQILGLRRQDQ